MCSELQRPMPQAITAQVILIVNGRDEKTRAYLEQHTPFTVLQCDRQTPASARNQALAQAVGEWILFLDDDVQLPADYFAQALKTLAQCQPDVLGGPEIAFPNSTPFQKAYAFCQSHPFLTGHTYRRHHTGKGPPRPCDESHLILCQLWVKKKVFKQGLGLPPLYQRNEENVLLHRAQVAGHRIFYDPRLYVYHSKKKTTPQVIKATLTSGKFRMRSFIDYPKSFHPLFLCPLLFVLLLTLLLILLLLAIPPGPLAHYLFFLYGILSLLTVGQCLVSKKNLSTALWVALLIPTIHISYGLGMLLGCLGKRWARRNSAVVP